MSSPEPPRQTLIPGGLPPPYIGGYAVIGIASLAYISVMIGSPSEVIVDTDNSHVASMSETDQTIDVAENSQDSNALSAEVDARPDTTPPQSAHASQPEPEPTPPRQTEVAEPTAQPAPGIETKFVTTQQILASRLENAAPQPDHQAQRAASTAPAAIQKQVPANTSNIITGSIKVPPPPERAPPPPAVIRAALKPAVAPALPAPVRTEPKRPAAPVTFGPAVVTEARSRPEQPPALAVLLATGSSVESLRLTWNLLKERHAAALLDLAPRYIVEKNPSAPERSFALLAGPVISATAVARVCGALVSEGLTCRTRPFGGNSL